jgi:hypothetical protein
MKYRYFWKELTKEGLLKEPTVNLPEIPSQLLNNGKGGFRTEQEAEEHFAEVRKLYGWWCPRDLVLIKVYSVYRFD